MIGDIRDLGRQLGRPPSLAEALDYLDSTLDELLKRGMWSRLLADAGLGAHPICPDEEQLEKGIRRLAHIDDAEQIRHFVRYLSDDLEKLDPEGDTRAIEMLHISLWGKQGKGWNAVTADEKLRQNPGARADLRAVLEYQLAHATALHAGRAPDITGPLSIQAQYSRDEALIGLGYWSLAKRPEHREGVLHLRESKLDAFFVTLQKTEEEYSPTTMYEDYFISHDLFHWQSQSGTSVDSPTGQRYIHHREKGYVPLLFVRETRELSSGLTAPYVFLGPCEYVSHSGSRPISIVWRLKHAVPARIYRSMARQVAV
jgi:hypothetical protein